MSGSTSIVPYKPPKTTTCSAINTVNDIQPPMDFSFFHTSNLEHLKDEEPRESPRKGKVVEKDDGKSQSRCLKLNNNSLTGLNDLMTLINLNFENLSQLAWIDLSFNELTHIDPILLEVENLQILYLHGNNIGNLKEVNTLEKMHTLKKLTLHGNPIEKEKGYRCYVLTHLPQLKVFDFSCVTKADKRTSQTWANMNSGAKSKKKHRDDDD